MVASESFTLIKKKSRVAQGITRARIASSALVLISCSTCQFPVVAAEARVSALFAAVAVPVAVSVPIFRTKHKQQKRKHIEEPAENNVPVPVALPMTVAIDRNKQKKAKYVIEQQEAEEAEKDVDAETERLRRCHRFGHGNLRLVRQLHLRFLQRWFGNALHRQLPLYG